MKWVWRQIHWSESVNHDDLAGFLRVLAADDQRGPVVLEVRAEAGQIRYLVGANESTLNDTATSLSRLAKNVTVTKPERPRLSAERAGRIRIRQREVAIVGGDATLRALLAALSSANKKGDVLVVQLVLGRGLPPRGVGARPVDPNQTFLDLALVGMRSAPADLSKLLRDKAGQYRFRAVARLGVASDDPVRRRLLVFGVMTALRQLQTAEVTIELLSEKPEYVNDATVPARKLLRLTPDEVLAFSAWPLGDRDLPGLPSRHPRRVAPPDSYKPPKERIFAAGSAPGSSVPVGISIRDALRHTHVMGPTGVGKSTLLLHLIASDIGAGRSVVIIDPKRDLGMDVLTLIPEHRRGDVVFLDPTLEAPVGLNPLADVRGQGPLVADGLLAVFKGLFPSMFGPRTSDALHASLLTLASSTGTSLADLPRLFTDPTFRRRLTARIDDPLGVGGFWAQYEAMSSGQQAAVVGPVLTRLRQFLLRPGVRAVIDQVAPRFRLEDLFSTPRILVVTLNKGLLGPEAAGLLGSIVVSQLWQHTLARAETAKSDRVPVSVYIDEAQSFLHLADLAEALEQSRSLGVAWHLAHQHRAQMPAALLAAIDANTRSKILFTLEAADATAVTRHSTLTPEDVTQLPPYEVYVNLEHRGARTGWMSARTLPPPAAISDPLVVLAESQALYGRRHDDAPMQAPPVASDDDAVGETGPVITTSRVVNETEPVPGGDEPIGRLRKAAL